MRKILLTIQYNGKNFAGWQIQPNTRTVESVLEDAISNLLQEKISLFASGRTDSGVHAIAQTAHFETNSNIPVEKLHFAINSKLPKDVAITSAKEVSSAFHARFDVKKKTYMYKLYASEVNLPLYDGFALRVHPKVLDKIEDMKKAASAFVGTHDFSGFCSVNTAVKDFVRTIYDIEIKQNGIEIEIFVTGNGFLYNMVRIIVGTLLDVAMGKTNPSNIPAIIASKDRRLAGETVKAEGLYLWRVGY
ncbi:MAG: tRNA pseudouridine(38-40) synthase TruA [Clostridia bacterium]|nr:tRNA pseudouridine(38-40) synthase TruA [Clostridia bacterium]